VIAGQPLGLLLKRIVLAFWAMYFSMVGITNFIDLLGEFDVLHWTFLNSGNFEFLRSVVEVYDIGPDLTKVLLVMAWLLEVTGAILFWRALLSYGRSERGERAALMALAWGTLVWVGFVFNTEFFVAYTAEAPFRELLMISLASILVITQVSDRGAPSSSAP
jgi:hypothetical protein